MYPSSPAAAARQQKTVATFRNSLACVKFDCPAAVGLLMALETMPRAAPSGSFNGKPKASAWGYRLQSPLSRLRLAVKRRPDDSYRARCTSETRRYPEARLFGKSVLLAYGALRSERWRGCVLVLIAGWLQLAPLATVWAGEGGVGVQRQPAWKSLFDGKTLGDWKPSNFGGEGAVTVANQQILLDFGDSLTGIVYGKPFPKRDYEVRLQAMRVDGNDFFCGLTFPVAESHCSFIIGGWAGAVVGLSSIDGRDASENATTQYMKFDEGRWYQVRVRVTADRVQCWIDERRVVDQDIRGRRLSTRAEVEPSKPLGIAAWQTKAALRGIEYRPLTEGER